MKCDFNSFCLLCVSISCFTFYIREHIRTLLSLYFHITILIIFSLLPMELPMELELPIEKHTFSNIG